MDYRKEDFSSLDLNPFHLAPGEVMWEKYPQLGRRRAFTEVPPVNDVDINEQDDFNEADIGRNGGRRKARKRKKEGYQPTLQDLNKLIIFAVLFCEPVNNPLASERDLDRRRAVALSLAGIKKGTELFNMIADSHFWVGLVIMEYFKMCNSALYETWFALKEQFHADTAYLRSPLEGEVEKVILAKQKIAAGLDDSRKRLAGLEAQLFPDTRTKLLAADAASSDKLIRWAEKYALD